MGWMAVLLWDDMKNAISEMGLNYIVSGGLCYSFGVIFFAIGENKPIGHVIWHIFVMMGSLL
jgi:hemolysin III